MLGKVAHWLANRHEAKCSASDASVQQRYNALVRSMASVLLACDWIELLILLSLSFVLVVLVCYSPD